MFAGLCVPHVHFCAVFGFWFDVVQRQVIVAQELVLLVAGSEWHRSVRFQKAQVDCETSHVDGPNPFSWPRVKETDHLESYMNNQKFLYGKWSVEVCSMVYLAVVDNG